jgi:hypothetical protein
VFGGSGVIKWAVSVVDTQFHAIDVEATHPSGVYRALCGHVLLAALEDSCRVPCLVCFGHLGRRATRRE